MEWIIWLGNLSNLETLPSKWTKSMNKWETELP